MTNLADIYAFVGKEAAIPIDKLSPSSDLEGDLGVAGDDFSELMEAFANEFKVDMSSYLWYFHQGEEISFNPGALFFRSPHRRVARIAVTPQLLLSASQGGFWPVIYPEHSLPGRRYDLLLTYFIAVAATAIFVVIHLWSKNGT